MAQQEIPVDMIVADYITGHLNSPFRWGEHDCATFAVGWVSIVKGRDMLRPFGKWKNERQAARALVEAGGFQAACDLYLRRIHPHNARDGDIAIDEDGKTLYLFSGSHIVGPGAQGLVFKSRMEATCAWSF